MLPCVPCFHVSQASFALSGNSLLMLQHPWINIESFRKLKQDQKSAISDHWQMHHIDSRGRCAILTWLSFCFAKDVSDKWSLLRANCEMFKSEEMCQNLWWWDSLETINFFHFVGHLNSFLNPKRYLDMLTHLKINFIFFKLSFVKI